MPFVMELPNYRLPSVRSVCQLIWDKAKDFITKAFTIIFVASIIIWFLQTFDTRFNVVVDSGDSLLALSLIHISFSNEGKRATASFSLTAAEAEQFRGNISFTATDMAGNTSDIKRDENRVNIVDNISPTRIVSYSPAKRVVDAATLLTKSSYTYEEENTNSIL